jgi:hypothetical protein
VTVEPPEDAIALEAVDAALSLGAVYEGSGR